MSIISIPQAGADVRGASTELSLKALARGFLRTYSAWVQAKSKRRLTAGSAVNEGAAYAEVRGM
jgi:hypothetical protein